MLNINRKILKDIKKGNDGVTLVALIITIIVLLILAGVAFNTLLGDSGLLNRASNAGDITKKTALQEQVELDISDVVTGLYAENKPVNLKSIIGELEEYDYELIAIEPTTCIPSLT